MTFPSFRLWEGYFNTRVAKGDFAQTMQAIREREREAALEGGRGMCMYVCGCVHVCLSRLCVRGCVRGVGEGACIRSGVHVRVRLSRCVCVCACSVFCIMHANSTPSFGDFMCYESGEVCMCAWVGLGVRVGGCGCGCDQAQAYIHDAARNPRLLQTTRMTARP